MEMADVRKLRHLQQENMRLEKVLAERDLDVEVMKELQAKKVVSPHARRQRAKVACAWGLRTRRAAWLCATPRSGLHYRSGKVQRDARLAQALRGLITSYPQGVSVSRKPSPRSWLADESQTNSLSLATTGAEPSEAEAPQKVPYGIHSQERIPNMMPGLGSLSTFPSTSHPF